MKLLIFILLGFSLSLTSINCLHTKKISSKDNDSVRIFVAWPGYDYLPYYSWAKSDKEPIGIEPTLIKTILDKAKIKYRFVTDFYDSKDDPRIDVLSQDKADISIRCISITDERKKIVDFTTPYYYDGVGVLVLNSSKIKTKSDLINKKIFAVKYTTGYTWIENEIKTFEYVKPETKEQSLNPEKMLDSGLIEAYVLDYSFLNNLKQKNLQYRLLDQKFTKEPWGIAVNKKRTDLLNVINKELITLKNSGGLDKITNELE